MLAPWVKKEATTGQDMLGEMAVEAEWPSGMSPLGLDVSHMHGKEGKCAMKQEGLQQFRANC